MIFRLIHPEHGATHVYDIESLKRHEAWGWKVEEPKPQTTAKVVEMRKRGRPPKQ